MRKIPTIFVRNPDDRAHVLDEVTSGCEWALAGEGVATRKYDGTCVILDERRRWWARREVKPGKEPPPNWVEVDHDETTGKRMGWEPIEQTGFAKLIDEAAFNVSKVPGTYELVGPKVNGNPEKLKSHTVIRHAAAFRLNIDYPATLEGLRVPLESYGWEGIVWHHPDGRMAKLKLRDLPPFKPSTGDDTADEILERIRAEVRPELDGRYDCCGCSTYAEIVADIEAIVREAAAR